MNTNSYTISMLTKKCKTCGKLFEVISSSGNKGDYCSKECHYNRNGGKVIKICETCGEPFEVVQSKKDRSKYCSKKCYTNKNGGRVVKICETCGESFEVKSSRVSAKYCSKDCYYNRNGEGIVKICKTCGESFIVYPCHKDQIHCSEKCYINSKPHIIKICEICGNEFKVRNSYKHARFCSIECQGVWQSQTRIGKNSANWQGGLSYGKYCSLFNEKFKEQIREFYNRRCFLCGRLELDRKNDIHHVNYDKNCLCGTQCEFVPLCRSCHAKTNYNRKYWEDLIMCYLYPERYFIIDM